MIKNVLFDLDGTLLKMDLEAFEKMYVGTIYKKIASHRPCDLEKFKVAFFSGLEAMYRNDGSKTNEEAFFEKYKNIFPDEFETDLPIFMEYYNNEFSTVKTTCGKHEIVPELVKELKEKGFRVAVATNPLFPRIATLKRLEWAGLKEEDFELVSTYEDYSFTKPNPKYFEDVLNRLNMSAEDTIMVGNDVEEDYLPASSLGMDTYLIKDCLLNKKNRDLKDIKVGTFEEFRESIFKNS